MTFVWPWIFTVHCTLLSSTSSSLLIWLNGLQGGTVVTILDICESLLWFELLGETGIDLVLKKGQKVKQFVFIYYITYFFILTFECDVFFRKGNHILYLKNKKKNIRFPPKIFIHKKNKPIFRKMRTLTERILQIFLYKLVNLNVI